MLRGRNILSQEVKEYTKKLVKQCHKFQLQVQEDQFGRKIIGYNHTITPQDVVITKITQEEAEILLNKDLQQKVYKQAENYWGFHLKNMESWRIAAILDATYNCGNLRWPKLTQAVFRCNWQDAAEQLMDSRYAHQVGDRAKRNACILRDNKQYTLDTQNWDLDEEDD